MGAGKGAGAQRGVHHGSAGAGAARAGVRGEEARQQGGARADAGLAQLQVLLPEDGGRGQDRGRSRQRRLLRQHRKRCFNLPRAQLCPSFVGRFLSCIGGSSFSSSAATTRQASNRDEVAVTIAHEPSQENDPPIL
jgi:hypothetical protein